MYVLKAEIMITTACHLNQRRCITFNVNDARGKRNILCINGDIVQTSNGRAVIQFLFLSLYPDFEGQQGKETQGWFPGWRHTHLWSLWSAIPTFFVWESVIVSAELEGCHSKWHLTKCSLATGYFNHGI